MTHARNEADSIQNYLQNSAYQRYQELQQRLQELGCAATSTLSQCSDINSAIGRIRSDLGDFITGMETAFTSEANSGDWTPPSPRQIQVTPEEIELIDADPDSAEIILQDR